MHCTWLPYLFDRMKEEDWSVLGFFYVFKEWGYFSPKMRDMMSKQDRVATISLKLRMEWMPISCENTEPKELKAENIIEILHLF